MPTIPSELSDVRDKLWSGQSIEPISARTLLRWFKAERRSPLTNAYIRAALDELGLIIAPGLEAVNIDAPITFLSLPKAPLSEIDQSLAGDNDTARKQTSAAPIAHETAARRDDPTLRVRILNAAIRYPIVVSPDAEITHATTLMLSKDYSQLPVIANHKLRGAISWRSIGRRLALGVTVRRVRECLEDPIEIRSDAPLLHAIEQITQSDYALIIDDSRRLVGLVTTADVSREFRNLSEPFLLLREAENYIRNILEACFTIEELKRFRDSNIERNIETVADLTLGEYLRALSEDATWERLKLPVDRKLFVNSLDQVRSIRNDVMHFDPDPIEVSRLAILKEFVRLLQAVGESSFESKQIRQ